MIYFVGFCVKGRRCAFRVRTTHHFDSPAQLVKDEAEVFVAHNDPFERPVTVKLDEHTYTFSRTTGQPVYETDLVQWIKAGMPDPATWRWEHGIQSAVEAAQTPSVQPGFRQP